MKRLLTWISETRVARWLGRYRLELELAWHLTCGAMVWVTIILPTPRLTATLVGCGVLLLLEQGLALRALRRRLDGLSPIVIRDCKTAFSFVGGTDAPIELNEAVRRAIIELTEQAPPAETAAVDIGQAGSCQHGILAGGVCYVCGLIGSRQGETNGDR